MGGRRLLASMLQSLVSSFGTLKAFFFQHSKVWHRAMEGQQLLTLRTPKFGILSNVKKYLGHNIPKFDAKL
jgi:hypothetical protein